MFISATVMDWRVNGGKRLSGTLVNDSFVLNTNRMFEITDQYQGHSQMFFFDDPWNSRDGGSRMVIWGDKANIPIAADTDHGSDSITLSYYPNHDTTVATKSITLEKKDIAYCFPKDHVLSANNCWVYYSAGGWDMQKILVNRDINNLFIDLEV